MWSERRGFSARVGVRYGYLNRPRPACRGSVVLTMIFMGGDLHMFISEHAIIIIFGGRLPPR
jgi:hypothetical protein